MRANLLIVFNGKIEGSRRGSRKGGHGYCLFSIVASLKAVQCIELRAKGRFSYNYVFYFFAPLCNCEVCAYVAGA